MYCTNILQYTKHSEKIHSLRMETLAFIFIIVRAQMRNDHEFIPLYIESTVSDGVRQ